MLRGKNALTSLAVFSNDFCAAGGMPMNTVFVAASAAPGTASAVAAAAAQQTNLKSQSHFLTPPSVLARPVRAERAVR